MSSVSPSSSASQGQAQFVLSPPCVPDFSGLSEALPAPLVGKIWEQYYGAYQVYARVSAGESTGTPSPSLVSLSSSTSSAVSKSAARRARRARLARARSDLSLRSGGFSEVSPGGVQGVETLEIPGFLALFRDVDRAEVHRELGSSPSFDDILKQPWVKVDKLVAYSLCVAWSDDSWYLTTAGPKVASVLATFSRMDRYADATVGAVMSGSNVTVDLSSRSVTSTYLIGDHDRMPGFCYLPLFRPDKFVSVRALLGPFPRVSQLMSIPADLFKSQDELEVFRVGKASEKVCHVSVEGDESVVELFSRLARDSFQWPVDAIARKFLDRASDSVSAVSLDWLIGGQFQLVWPSMLPSVQGTVPQKKVSATRGSSLTPSERVDILRFVRSNPEYTQSQVAAKFLIDRSTVSKLVRKDKLDPGYYQSLVDQDRIDNAVALPFYFDLVLPSESSYVSVIATTTERFGYRAPFWCTSNHSFDLSVAVEMYDDDWMFQWEECKVDVSWVSRDLDLGHLSLSQIRFMERHEFRLDGLHRGGAVNGGSSLSQIISAPMRECNFDRFKGLRFPSVVVVSDSMCAHVVVDVSCRRKGSDRWSLLASTISVPVIRALEPVYPAVENYLACANLEACRYSLGVPIVMEPKFEEIYIGGADVLEPVNYGPIVVESMKSDGWDLRGDTFYQRNPEYQKHGYCYLKAFRPPFRLQLARKFGIGADLSAMANMHCLWFQNSKVLSTLTLEREGRKAHIGFLGNPLLAHVEALIPAFHRYMRGRAVHADSLLGALRRNRVYK